MRSRQVIVDKMKSWLGCHEGDSIHKHIIDTYNAHKPLARGYKVKYTDAWCATTVSAAFIECSYTDIFVTECSCNKMITLLQKKGMWQENDAYVPNPGDVIFYDWQDNGVGDNKGTSEHVGIVETVENGSIIVIEGNKSDGVAKRTLKVNGRYIRGFGIPKYDVATPVIKKKYSYGVDLSANQGNVDFNKVKAAGYEFVILRSTTKNGKADTKFEQYYSAATKAGLKVAGVYKYSYAMSVAEAHKEAESVIKLLNGRKIDIWYDLEDKSQLILGTTGIGLIATAFLTYCVNKGYNVGIYCNKTWYDNYISWDIKNICRFWVARYGKNTGQLDEYYKPNGKGIVMWQYTSKGKVDGIEGNVDLNVKW